MVSLVAEQPVRLAGRRLNGSLGGEVKRRNNTAQLLGVFALAVLALLLRLNTEPRAAFHSDEYLTMYRSLLVSEGDFFLRSDPSQKPPLFYLLNASMFKLFGPSREVPQMISLAASVAAVPLTAALVTALGGGVFATLLGAALVALSPFQIAFSNTAFLDPTMISLGLGGVLLFVQRRFFWAGILLGLAFSTKQQAALFLPACIFLLPIRTITRRELVAGAGGLAIVFLALLGWSAGSGGFELPHFVSGQILNEQAQIGDALLINPFTEGSGAWSSRFVDWSRFVGLFFGPFTAPVICLVAIATLLRSASARCQLARVLLFCLACLLFIVIVRFRIVDRYVLILLPFLAVAISLGVDGLSPPFARSRRVASALFAALIVGSCVVGLKQLGPSFMVVPESAGARPRLIGQYTEGSPVTFRAADAIRSKLAPGAQILVHPALFAAAVVEFSHLATIRSTDWSLRLPTQGVPFHGFLIWDGKDTRRFTRFTNQLAQRDLAIEPLNPLDGLPPISAPNSEQRLQFFVIGAL